MKSWFLPIKFSVLAIMMERPYLFQIKSLNIKLSNIRNGRLEIFCKKGVLKIFAKFTKSNCAGEFILIKFQAGDM